MKISICGIEMEVSNWSPRLRWATFVISLIALCSALLTLLFQVTVPGLSPIALGCTLLLLGVKSLNEGAGGKNRAITALGVFQTLLFILCLCLGISQIVDVIGRAVGL